MAGVFVALAVLGYFVFLIDWKELREVLALGGWGSVVIYGIITVCIISVLNSAPAVTAQVMQH